MSKIGGERLSELGSQSQQIAAGSAAVANALAGPDRRSGRTDVIAALRAQIGAIDALTVAGLPMAGAERGRRSRTSEPALPVSSAEIASRGATGWRFGIDPVDRCLASRPHGPMLENAGASGLMEMKPLAYRDTPATITFGLIAASLGHRASRRRPMLLVATAEFIREFGTPYGPGLLPLGIDLDALLLVTAANRRDALWALEEGLRSAAIAAAIGLVRDVSLIAGRRLQLAADATATSCLLITDHAEAAVSVARTRWRIATSASAGHPFDAAAPGARRWHMILERSGQQMSGQTFQVEWSDETRRLALVSPLADRAAAAGDARRTAG